MIRKPASLASYLLSFFSPVVFAGSNLSYFFNFESASFSDGMSIKTILEDFNGEYRDGKVAYSNSQIESGFLIGLSGKNYLSISATRRYGRWYSFSQDTGKAFHDGNNNSLVDGGAQYDIDLEVFGFISDGFKVGSFIGISDKLSLYFSATYMAAYDLTVFDGDGRMYSSDSLPTTLNYTYYYDDDVILGRPVNPRRGKGTSFDLSLFYDISDSWFGSILFKDIGSFISWDDAPISIMAINNVPVTISEDNKFNIVPYISGVEGYYNIKKRIPWSNEINVSYIKEDGKGVYVSSLNNEYFNDLAIGIYSPFSIKGFKIDYSMRAKAVNFSYETEATKLSMKLDSIYDKDISTAGLSFFMKVKI